MKSSLQKPSDTPNQFKPVQTGSNWFKLVQTGLVTFKETLPAADSGFHHQPIRAELTLSMLSNVSINQLINHHAALSWSWSWSHACLHGNEVLRVGQNDGARAAGRTNHTTCTRSLTFDLPNHGRGFDGTPQEVIHDEAETHRKHFYLPFKIKPLAETNPVLIGAGGAEPSSPWRR